MKKSFLVHNLCQRKAPTTLPRQRTAVSANRRVSESPCQRNAVLAKRLSANRHVSEMSSNHWNKVHTRSICIEDLNFRQSSEIRS